MTINLKMPEITEMKPRLMVFGVGGAGGNAVNNMIAAGLQGVDFVVANTDAQALTQSRSPRVVQMGIAVTEGLGAGAQPAIGQAAAEETIDELRDHLTGAHMAFITAGMGGGTGTGAAPVIARTARDMGILTVGVVTKPFNFEGPKRMKIAEAGIAELQKHVDTLIVIPNQNLFRVANERTPFADAFAMADQVLYSGVASITDLMVKEGLINLDFADVRSVMREMGKAMMGTGEASGENRAIRAAEQAISNPLLDHVSMSGAKGLLISVTGGRDMTLYELDEAASRIRQEVDQDASIIVGATYDDALEGIIRVSVVATGIDIVETVSVKPTQPIMGVEAARIAAAKAAQKLEEILIAPPVPRANPVAQPIASEPMPQAVAQDPDVMIRARPQMTIPTPFMEPSAAPIVVEETPAPPAAFIPPEPVRPEPARTPIAPNSIADLPPQMQRVVQQHQQAQTPTATSPAEEKRTGLLEGLRSFGFGRKRDGEAHEQPQAVQPPRPVVAQPQRAVAMPPEQRRPVQPEMRLGGTDQPARPGQSRASEDETLEIPAFLRRQS